MATTEITHPAETELGTGLGERVQRVFAVSAARVAAVWRAAKNRRAVNGLLDWDDRMLRDIGLTQNDVRAALSGRLAEDPSPQLQLLSSERRAAIRAQRREAHLREQFTPRQG